MLKFYLKSIFIGLLFAAGLNPCRAQYHIPLDSVAKITFVANTPFWAGRYFKKVEAVQENGKWKLYQIEYHTSGTDELQRKFLRPISKKDISALLKLIGNSDTVIHTALFKVDKKKLLTAYDTLLPFLKPRQRSYIAKKINPQVFLDKMVKDQVHREESDRNSYLIAIKTKGGRSFDITAYANRAIYAHLPWTIGSLQSYDPRISEIFDGIVERSFDSYSVRRFYDGMAFGAFMSHFKTMIAVDNLKEEFPLAYRCLLKTFKPVLMGDNNSLYNLRPRRPVDSLYYMGGFQAVDLPEYVNIYFNFKPVDTATISAKERYLDTIKPYFQKSNFLFKYFETRPDATLCFNRILDEYNTALNYESIRKVFTGIVNYDVNKIQIVKVTGKPDVKSKWLLLPDNTLVLCSYLNDGWNKSKNQVPHFMGLDDALIKLHYWKSNSVCLHFDATGKLIKDYGDSADNIFSN